jgi:hypothetical protein
MLSGIEKEWMERLMATKYVWRVGIGKILLEIF